MHIYLHVKYPHCQISIKLEFSRQIFENTQILNFMKIRPVGPSYSMRTGGRANRHGQVKVAFRNFAKESFKKNEN
jgi:hypothetical protein